MLGKMMRKRRRVHLVKRKILSTGVFLLIAFLTSSWAADVLGNWIVRAGKLGMSDAVFSFKVNGAELTGTVADAEGETAIREGKIDGDDISFVVIRSVLGNEMKLVYKGKVELNEIKFVREVEGGKGLPQEFIAKREFPRNGDIPVQPARIKQNKP
jgi:hypothetical protein